MSVLVLITQPEQIDELIFLEVENVRFLVRVKEIGLSKSFDNINGKNRVKEREGLESIQENDDEIVSELGSTTRMRPKKNWIRDKQTGDDEAINAIFLEKENDNGGYQRTWENEPN
ncbi:hypothetical protein PVK06_030551 [Gossypium arboreum]|uniref:Uncharacterized protein n=1 Tax=Gossypium arboreum TaxID=29729 RepID=A0ABR0NNK5_GOSAR|nr:hypothetical protein PVK06_030551 [Gossypium arboreum]